jgi:alpha-glucosidase
MSFEAMKNNLFQNIKNSAFASSILLGILFSPAYIQAKTVEEVPHSKSNKNEVSSTKEQSKQTDLKNVKSPDGKINLIFFLDENGTPFYKVLHDQKVVIANSRLGINFKQALGLSDNFSLINSTIKTVDETWNPVLGEDTSVRNNYQELTISLQQKNSAQYKMNLIFRVYNDGIGFRYVVPKQDNLNKVIISDELTEFSFSDDHQALWIPNEYDTYELLYHNTPLSKIGKVKIDTGHSHSSQSKNYPAGANTPLTMQTKNGLFLSIHEAALLDYAGMTLIPKGKNRLTADLVPWPNGDKVRTQLPFKTPWRSIQIADDPGKLVESKLIVNLNEPNTIKDTSYIKPMKYVGIWWSMHLGITTWSKEGGKHGATTEEAMRYIDFAANNNIQGVLIEGWNTGWESWYQDDNFDFSTPYEDFDLEKVAQYAQEKNVALIGHHETGGQVLSYESNLAQAFALYQQLGIRAVKTGYAGKIRPEGYYHHGQFMVDHYTKVMKTAAKYGIMLNVHEPIKPTGLRRTYPNLMTGEGVRGMEWNAWSRGNPPEHTVNLVFTRMLAGPLDYTPGIFDLGFDRYGHQYTLWNDLDGKDTKGRMQSTLARQLGLSVVLYSPMVMASDLVENYEYHPAFEFFRALNLDWEKSKVINAVIGDQVVIARKVKGEDTWFIGAITDEKARTFNTTLDFLAPNQTYVATLYTDAPGISYKNNPGKVIVEQMMVSSNSFLNLELAAGGGAAVHLRAVSKNHPGTKE